MEFGGLQPKAPSDEGAGSEADWGREFVSLPPSFASQNPPPSSEGGFGAVNDRSCFFFIMGV